MSPSIQSTADSNFCCYRKFELYQMLIIEDGNILELVDSTGCKLGEIEHMLGGRLQYSTFRGG